MDWLERVRGFEATAHSLLAQYESSQESRVVKLEETYSQLNLLNLKQDDLVRQALRCTEQGLYRAAHVMCWAAVMDFIEEKLEVCGIGVLLLHYPKWHKSKDVSELAEYVPERQLLEALKPMGLATKNQVKGLIGLLERRNECAHPTAYLPELNETLGYISESLKRIKTL